MLSRLRNRLNKSISYTLSSPIKGLNLKDNPLDMDEKYAVVMDNYIPLNNKVVLRKGYVRYLQTSAKVETLASYKTGAYQSFLAVWNQKLHNITSATNVIDFETPVLSVDNCRTQQYKNYLYFVNGTDVPKVYYIDENGLEHFENWGFSYDDNEAYHSIINVSVSKQRLWFVERNSLKVWYPYTAGNVAGILQSFDLSAVARFGGHLVAVANWTQDGGAGIDDLTVFITSEGEALIYSGSDINSADNWKLCGSYKISRPIGYDCLVSYQGDVVIISEDGYIPLSRALPLDKANLSQIAFSDAISPLVLERTQKYSACSGWQGIIYGRGGYGIINVPVANQFEQHVINVNSSAWCRFTGINAFCWKEFAGRMYFGSKDGIYLFDEGYSDNGTRISGVVEQAYTDLGTANLKKIQLINPRTKAAGNYALVIYTNMDMEKRKFDSQESMSSSGVTKWNAVKWSSSANPIGTKWSSSSSNSLYGQWIANSSTGYKASIVFKTKTKGNLIEWYDTCLRFSIGNGVL